MKLALLSAAVLLGLATQAEAATVYYAPAPISTSGTVLLGLTATQDGVARDPFEGTSLSGTPFDAVIGGGSATFSVAAFGGSDPTLGTFTFFDGSPDLYNTLTFSNGATFTGSQIASPTTGAGGQLVTLSGIGSSTTVTFSSSSSSFEFAAVSPVPLPASLPMFGAALLVVAGASYGLNRRNATKAKSIASAA